jgi:hypothetical protein
MIKISFFLYNKSIISEHFLDILYNIYITHAHYKKETIIYKSALEYRMWWKIPSSKKSIRT